MTDAPQQPILRLEDEPVLYIADLVRTGADSRGIKVQQRKIVYGMPPPDWKEFLAALDCPYTVPMPNGKMAERVQRVEVEIDAPSYEEAFKIAAPLISKKMDEFIEKLERQILASQIKAGAAVGAHLQHGRAPGP